MTDEDRIILGNEAKQLLNSELVKSGFAQIEANAVEAMLKCAPDDDTGRFRLAERIKAIRELTEYFETLRRSGLQAELKRENED